MPPRRSCCGCRDPRGPPALPADAAWRAGAVLRLTPKGCWLRESRSGAAAGNRARARLHRLPLGDESMLPGRNLLGLGLARQELAARGRAVAPSAPPRRAAFMSRGKSPHGSATGFAPAQGSRTACRGAAGRAGSITACDASVGWQAPARAQRSPADARSKRSLGADTAVKLVAHPRRLRGATSRGGGRWPGKPSALRISLPRSSGGLQPSGPSSPPGFFATVSASFRHALRANLSWPGRERETRVRSAGSGAQAGREGGGTERL